MDSGKGQQGARFSAGDTFQSGDDGNFEAGINHLTTDGNVLTPTGVGTNRAKPAVQWFQRIAVYGNTAEQAEALRDEVLAAIQKAEAAPQVADFPSLDQVLSMVLPDDHPMRKCGIDNARAWLGGAFHREYKGYIEQTLAGDFACALVELFERKDQLIERQARDIAELAGALRKIEAADYQSEQSATDSDLLDIKSALIRVMKRAASGAISGLNGRAQ